MDNFELLPTENKKGLVNQGLRCKVVERGEALQYFSCSSLIRRGLCPPRRNIDAGIGSPVWITKLDTSAFGVDVNCELSL
jgi:hypothetical protein